MHAVRTFSKTGLALLVSSFTPAPFPAHGLTPVDYMLLAPSSYQRGCFDGCDCPVTSQWLLGRFALEPVGTDPFFAHYALREIDWTVAGPIAIVHITGSGEYRVGTEFTSHQQMILDLSFDGGAVHRFDSGVVAGGSDFPRIAIDVAAHGFACFDSVLSVYAAPRTVAAIGNAAAPAQLAVAGSNPFGAAGARLDVVVANPARVDLRIYDVRGRLVRTLVDGTTFAAGRTPIGWDGRLDGGGAAPSGVYVVRLAANNHVVCRRIAKLE